MLRILRRRGVDPQPTFFRNGSFPGRALGLVAMAATLLACGPLAARAVTVVVPDDWPTIQQAIDSGADEVLVRPGVYPETLVVDRAMDLKGLVPYGTSPDSLPVVAGLVFEDFRYIEFNTMYLRVWSLHILSQVRNQFETSPFWDPLEIELAGCALDGGLVDVYPTGGQIEYYLRRSRIDGPVRVVIPQLLWVEDCTIRAPMTLPSGIERLLVTRCDFHGPRPSAIDIRDGECEITRSTFEGFETPIRHGSSASNYVASNTFVGPGIVPVQTMTDDADLSFHDNRVTGFHYGILVSGGWGYLYASRNAIEDCDAGIRAETRDARLTDNTVRSCRSGVTLQVTDGLWVSDNVVRACGGDGMVLDAGYATVQSNSVGRCEGAGFRLTTSHAYANDSYFRGNTSYRNGGSGVVVSTPDPYGRWHVERNIAFENGGHGVEFGGSGAIQLACNDWFGNPAGDLLGADPAATDVFLDPLFCDVARDDVHLSAISPLLEPAQCGTIGALLGRGCDAPMVSRLTTFTVVPRIEGVQVRWQVADSAPGFVAWIERAVAATGPWTAVSCERATDGDVTVELDRSAEPSRIYWYRLVANDRGVTRALGDAVRVETDPPQSFALLGTGPNPSPGALEATFQLARAADIMLEIFDAQGRRMASLARGTWPAGIHRATWNDGSIAAAGLYLLRYRYPGGEARRRIVLVR